VKREDMVRLIAPISPPCFETRDVWVSYCESAAAEQRLEHMPGPLVFDHCAASVRDTDDLSGDRYVLRRTAVPVLIFAELRVRFNPMFDFCEECTSEHRDSMLRARRCNPDYVRELLEP
jgi:hypothetical protein